MKYIFTNQFGKSIEFHKDSAFRMLEVDGQSANELDFEESSVANQIGSTLDSFRVEPKSIDFSADFKYSPYSKRILLDTILPGKGTIRYINEEEDMDVFIEGIVTETPDIKPQDKFYKPFEFTLYASFPYWMKSDEGIIDFVSYESRFRLPRSFSGTVPWKISEKIVNQLNTIKNEGSVPIGFIVTFKALDTVVNPELLKVNTQEKMTFRDLTMEVGDVLTISTVANQHYVRLIHDGIESNVFFKTTFEFSFFQLDVGNNPIRFDAESGVGNLEVNIDFHTTYAGV